MASRAGVVAGWTLLSRVLGFVRDKIVAYALPPETTDLFYLAFTIPNALRGLLAEGAVSAALVPVYTKLREQEGDARAREFHARFSGAMLAILGAVSIAGVLGAPALTAMFASGWMDEPERFETTVSLVRWVFPYIFFMGAAALGMGVLNAHRRFAIPAFAPALLNVALIAAPFTLVAPAASLGLPPVGALALAALIGGVLQWAVQVPGLRAIGIRSLPRLSLSDAAVRDALWRLVPLTLGLGVYQLNVMLSRQLASYLPAGAQSYVYYGTRVVEIPQAIFGISIASVALPALSSLFAQGAMDELKRTFAQALRTSLFIAIPATVGIVVLARPIVGVLFQGGEFDAHDADETAWSLAWQGAGVWAIAAVRVVVPMFHAQGDTRAPVWASAANLVTFAAVSIALLGPMRHAGIGAGISIAGMVQLVVLLAMLRRRLGTLGLGSVLSSAWRAAIASAVMGALAWGVTLMGDWSRGGHDVRNVAVLALAVVLASVVYFALTTMLGAPEATRVADALKRRIGRRR